MRQSAPAPAVEFQSAFELCSQSAPTAEEGSLATVHGVGRRWNPRWPGARDPGLAGNAWLDLLRRAALRTYIRACGTLGRGRPGATVRGGKWREGNNRRHIEEITFIRHKTQRRGDRMIDRGSSGRSKHQYQRVEILGQVGRPLHVAERVI